MGIVFAVSVLLVYALWAFAISVSGSRVRKMLADVHQHDVVMIAASQPRAPSQAHRLMRTQLPQL